MSESRSICLAVLVSLLLHAMLLGIAAGGSTERTMAMALNDDQGVVTRLNGDIGAISVLLLSEDGASSTASTDTFPALENDDRRWVSTAVADVSESFPEPQSPNDPSDPADSAPTSPSGAAQAIRHSIPLDDYNAQIMGRIERAWVRPLAHLEGAFRCEVQISQTPQGEVRDITLTQCDGDPVWRQSITQAIRYASPLPAPPSEKAFRSVLTLDFQAEPLSPTLLARLLSMPKELSPVEHSNVAIQPAGSGAPVDGPRAANPHAQ
jgi:membrane protein involved in colicin uptake